MLYVLSELGPFSTRDSNSEASTGGGTYARILTRDEHNLQAPGNCTAGNVDGGGR